MAHVKQSDQKGQGPGRPQWFNHCCFDITTVIPMRLGYSVKPIKENNMCGDIGV